jgi:hypothetical protein
MKLFLLKHGFVQQDKSLMKSFLSTVKKKQRLNKHETFAEPLNNNSNDNSVISSYTRTFPATLLVEDIDIITNGMYVITEKSNGIRCTVYIDIDALFNTSIYVITRKQDNMFVLNNVYKMNDFGNMKKDIKGLTILDCEFLEDLSHTGQGYFLMFDTPHSKNNQFVSLLKYEDRMNSCKELLDLLLQFNPNLPHIKMKRVYKPNEFEILLNHITNDEYKDGMLHNKNDGLLFTHSKYPHPALVQDTKEESTLEKMLMKVYYKWKKPEHQTVDFELQITRCEMLENNLQNCIIRYSLNSQVFFTCPLKYKQETYPGEDKDLFPCVMECRLDTKTFRPILTGSKPRKDKKSGNAPQTYTTIVQAISNPVYLSVLREKFKKFI